MMNNYGVMMYVGIWIGLDDEISFLIKNIIF